MINPLINSLSFRAALLLALAFSCSAPAQESKVSRNMQSLAETERAFARTSVEKGMRAAFMAYFAEDGINFQPHPVNTQEAFRKTPAPPGPPPFTLDWRPVFGDVSAAGDMGYNTGPYMVTDNTPQHRAPRHGMFFSVWKKQPDGAWKVAVDIGTPTPGPAVSFNAPFTQAGGGSLPAAQGARSADRSRLLQIEADLHSDAQRRGLSRAWLDRISDESRLHREGHMPIIGRKAIQSYLSAGSLTLRFETLQAEIARSGDLGWTLGRYEQAAGKPEKGYYVRVWKRDASGRWKLMADITNALPAEEK